MYRSLRSFVFLASLPGCIWAVATPEVSFTVHNQMQVPGETLPAGNYTLLFEENILQDRAIVRLKNGTRSVNTLLLAVDPASDKLPRLPSMTADDMKIVHLCLLGYHKVGLDAARKLTATA